ncbi:MAG: ribonuclease P protein component [Desulfobulbus sp.]
MGGNHTFPRGQRLRLNREFQQVYREGKRRHGKGFSIITTPNSLHVRRMGISVQRKVGTAVRRNRIKRLFREVFRLHQEQFPRASDIVITVRPDFCFDTLMVLEQEVARVLQQGGTA